MRDGSRRSGPRRSSPNALPGRLRPKGRDTDTTSEGVGIGRENRPQGVIIARDFTPTFDKPAGLAFTASGRNLTDFRNPPPVEVGTRVMLLYQGKRLSATVTAVEVPQERFVGRVIEFDGGASKHGDLKHGDEFRFSYADLQMIGQMGRS